VDLLKALLENPGASIRDIEKSTGMPKSTVARRLKHLETDKLVAQVGRKWMLTKAGIGRSKAWNDLPIRSAER
jgi:DNA-binding IclR family transcriptional regulator